jgi:hypothetical protein
MNKKQVDNDKVYKKSNDNPQVKYTKLSGKEYKALLECGESVNERYIKAKKLLDYLCTKYKIAPITLVITDKPQPNCTCNGRLVKKTLGTYNPAFHKITMYNSTAIKKQAVSIKTFTHTLLHEFVHHYDFQVLKMENSLHCVGFYKRISDLQNKLQA